MELELELEKKNLKIQALLEKVSSLTTTYENQIADLRVNLTLLEKKAQHLEDTLNANEDAEVPVPEDELS